ncbi:MULTISPECIES: hypothetical protein [unclassified Bacillus (in: firmicutes)]|uniref:hypothetical protein n=1 Tax=unclassified Bacillus (in: firmicutes) TaxID=185979 RepID=UPI000BF3725D|nr:MULTISPECIES: hypothetical protein [unclassified Bacillus (in: firmicutes)]PEU15514.1 hypothetical protein CN525_17360 [Bacillus sp. AFS014408]PFW57946.1 hypothetical protein COL20_25935 [Bacillus sp. AFS075034]
MSENKRNMMISFVISVMFIILSVMPISINPNIYAIVKIGAVAGAINMIVMSTFLYFRRKRMKQLLH